MPRVSSRNSSRNSYRIGIDVGGTFTKAVIIDNATREVRGRYSVHTTHAHAQGVAAGVVEVFERVLRSAAVTPDDVVFIAHSTTQATNAMLEGDVAHVGIVGIASKALAKLARDQSNIPAIELAPGRVLKTSHAFLIDEDVSTETVEDAIGMLVRDGAQVLVSSAAFGVDDTASEEFVRTVGKEHGLPTTCGHELTRLYGLSTRTRTAVINASILPRMIATADLTADSVRAAGIDAPLMIVRGDGGVMDIREMRRRPALTMLSGPAASVAGALMHVRMSDGIYFEVGGTSTNLGVIKAGRPAVAYATIGGHGTFVSSLDVRVLGVAGGSLIQIDGGSICDVGPRSAHIAGLRYSCFEEPAIFDGAHAVLFEPRPGDGGGYVAVETRQHGRFALTTTCAANALALTTPEMHCHAPPAAARAAFSALARHLDGDIDRLATAVLEAAAAKIIPVVESLIAQYELDDDQQVFIGQGGGIGTLLPFVAGRMGMRHVIAKDAEVISSIGAALALVREVVERVNPNPSPDDIAVLRAEALAAVTRLGADPKTVEIAIEIDRHNSRVSAIATGAAALRTAAPQKAVSEAEARAIAAQSFARPETSLTLVAHTSGAFVYRLDEAGLQSVRIVDRQGNVRLQRSRATIRSTTAATWPTTLDSVIGPTSSDGRFDGAVMLYGRHIIDLTGVESLSQARDLIKIELTDEDPATLVILVGFAKNQSVAAPPRDTGV